jgi:alkylation response protein AidB-like acyl-CoA dehydrogenase
LLAGPVHLRERYLPPTARGELYLTVGLSQLTTSRQHRRPSLTAEPTPGGYRLDGEVPWVTGADRAAAIMIGATLPDGRQLVLALPTHTPGVSVGPPMPLAALCGSRTAAVRCDGVAVESGWVVAGPAEHVLGRVGGGGLETSALALGLAGAAVERLAAEAAVRPDLAPAADRFEAARAAARGRLYAAARQPADAAPLDVRVECTRLALRTTQAALTTAKGSGFVAPHPAQRWARQALFFLDWSCPRPVADGVLADLLPDPDRPTRG